MTLFSTPFLNASIFTHLSTRETVRFQNDAFSKGSPFETVFDSLRFHQRPDPINPFSRSCVFIRKRISGVGAGMDARCALNRVQVCFVAKLQPISSAMFCGWF